MRAGRDAGGIGPERTAEPLRIVVVDDHPVFRMGMTALLGSLPGLSVVAEAESMETALTAARVRQPDVVVMDLHLGDHAPSGVVATRELLRVRPDTAVLVVTMLDDDDSVFAAMRAGARGYLLKGASPTEVERAVRAVANGEVILGPAVASRAVAHLTGRRSTGGGPSALPELTTREREVLDLVARGLDNLAISRRLMLSPKTVRNHLSNILAKLQAASRAEAIVRARQAGLGAD
ncbi:DNA-binding response regulator [Streptomyces viridiviolaceus]|uniref:Response regulator n=1 Tax=Streptomyces viridiviolaceus TaxID=68282 RepID=A0ABW2DY82_9ACTN|nr:response regulator transcription factor [Streptomyces viridiviolaceus]GHB58212.1 DNA-binding response regulator [Streptomyces viridiviolaceus]